VLLKKEPGIISTKPAAAVAAVGLTIAVIVEGHQQEKTEMIWSRAERRRPKGPAKNSRYSCCFMSRHHLHLLLLQPLGLFTKIKPRGSRLPPVKVALSVTTTTKDRATVVVAAVNISDNRALVV